MIQYNNFLIKREQSQACLSFAKREKSRLLAKTILTLVLLMTAATGAWAQGYYNININFDPVYNPEFTHFMCDVMGPDMPSGTLDLSIDNSYTGSFRVDNGMCSSEIHSLDAGDHTWYAEFIPDGGGEKSTEERSFTINQGFAYVYIDDPEQSSIEMGVGESRNFRGHVDGPESSEVNISSSNDNVAKFRASSSFSYGFEGYIDAVGAGTATITVSFAGNKNFKAAEDKTITVTVLAPAATGPEVAWDKAAKTGTFKMPGGNVELEPEYYPQAALTAQPTAINDVPATTDGAIVKAGTVANIGSTETAQGTVMYYVSTTEMTDAALLALAADQWTADVPTAESLTEGQAYVYYYVRGNDSDTDDENFSDGDILAANALTVTIAAEPTYAVTFAEGTDANEWSADPAAGVTKGQTVTVTYTGSKKVIGVKAEKKAAETLIVNPEVGQYIGSDGKNYDANATLPDGVTKVAKICYVGSDNGEAAPYNHGLALALEDVSSTKAWSSQTGATCLGTQYDTNTKFNDLAGIANTDALVNHTGHTHAAASAARNYNSGTHPAGTSAWFLPSAGQWNKMFTAAGGYANLKTMAGLQDNDENYWSSTECSAGVAWDFDSSDGTWYSNSKSYTDNVRACLAF